MAIVSAEQVLADLKYNAARDKAFYLLDGTEYNHSSYIAYVLQNEPDEQWVQRLTSKPMSEASMAELLEKSLHEDIIQKVGDTEQSLFSSCLLGVLPLHGINGHAQRRDFFDNILDRPLLLINYGVDFVCTQLAYALIFEILENDLAPYKQSGADFFHIAQLRYANKLPDKKLLERTSLAWLPTKAANEIRWYCGRLCAIMMWFVTLHEFAHVRNGDIDSPFWRSMCPTNINLETRFDKELLFIQEEAADQYAVARLGNWHDATSNVWSNFAQAYLLMRFLESMEVQQLIDNNTHPPALRRKELMLAHARKTASHSPPEDYADLLESFVEKWISEIQEG